METKQIILGIVTAAFVFGAYFIGLFQGQRHPIRWREFFRTMMGSLYVAPIVLLVCLS